ncbi:hypothetical protein AAFF_G00208540 [Aldrovandia affinis]|uniref:Uncharacterized protein n=1 Tax=Aldrovandia affinis TaxID=143900 RepID=A0AAD7RHG8_9TELE|nr:hypothetical protein AAFF_G00208540 [Aldrovandia affinis]
MEKNRSIEGSPSSSPKRKRGRPRKDSSKVAVENEAELVQTEKDDQGGKDTETASEGETSGGPEDGEPAKRKATDSSERDRKEVEGLDEQEGSSQPKKRRVVTCTSGTQELGCPAPSSPGVNQTAPQSEVTDSREGEVRCQVRENRHSVQKRPSSRQSSQDSARSSSPLSVSSHSTTTCSPLPNKEGVSSMPLKRKQVEVNASREEGDNAEEVASFLHTRSSESACSPTPFSVTPQHSSSCSDSDEGGQERRLTRAAQKKLEKAEETAEKDGGNNWSRRRSTRSPDAAARVESGSDASVRVTRKSSGPQPSLECRPQSAAVPEVLGKRCSALNAAAKLLAMRSRGGNEGLSSHGGRGLERVGRGGGRSRGPISLVERSNKTWRKVSHELNSCTNKAESRHGSADPSPTASRSTRQRPGCLVPPLETDTKRGKKTMKKTAKKEGERGGRGSPRGHSTSSSASSEGGEGSSRSRSSSMSSQRTHSLSSQSTGPLRSRAPSSCSDQERSQDDGDRAGEKRDRSKSADRGRRSRKERWRHRERDSVSSSQSRAPELSAGSSEGTPDRVLRSVAALAAAQARTPASNTRSSSTHHHQQQPHTRRTKT